MKKVQSAMMKLFLDNLGKDRQPLNVVKNSEEESTIYIYDVIGYYGIDAESFSRELNKLSTPVINLRFNTPGGDVFDGRAISSSIKAHKSKIVAYIDGVVASAGTFIASSCDEIHMSDGAFYMIHNAWTLAIGNSNDMQETADFLEKIDDSIRNDFVKRTDNSYEQVKQWMDDETWFNAKEALEHGFIDSIVDDEEDKGAENSDRSKAYNYSAYKNVPKNLTEQPKPEFNLQAMKNRLKLLECG